jgi:hypothetical protein
MVKTNQKAKGRDLDKVKAKGRDLDKVEVNVLWPIQLLMHIKCTDGLTWKPHNQDFAHANYRIFSNLIRT